MSKGGMEILALYSACAFFSAGPILVSHSLLRHFALWRRVSWTTVFYVFFQLCDQKIFAQHLECC